MSASSFLQVTQKIRKSDKLEPVAAYSTLQIFYLYKGVWHKNTCWVCTSTPTTLHSYHLSPSTCQIFNVSIKSPCHLNVFCLSNLMFYIWLQLGFMLRSTETLYDSHENHSLINLQINFCYSIWTMTILTDVFTGTTLWCTNHKLGWNILAGQWGRGVRVYMPNQAYIPISFLSLYIVTNVAYMSFHVFVHIPTNKICSKSLKFKNISIRMS